ncbi:hypothetical protein ACIBI7_50595 [Nonomuraea fuscirosea]|uniref:hypothetical protein n=1 Tax=Nonomuraea TaxID=83681 RepID=UPI0033FDEC1D
MTPFDLAFWTGWTVTAAAIAAAATASTGPWIVPAAMLAWIAGLAVVRIREHRP